MDYIPPSRRGECSVCGKTVQRNRTSADVIVCLVCRRKSPTYKERQAPAPRETLGDAECPICGVIFEKLRHNQRYCSTICRESRRGWSNATKVASAEERGYGKAHREERERWKPTVASGRAVCCLCGHHIEPDDRWHLDHNEDRTGYRGVAHAACNIKDGARRGARRTNRKRSITKTCATCNRQFTTPFPKQRYCSRECKPKREGKPAVCKVSFPNCRTCGHTFCAHGTRRVYCDDECAYLAALTPRVQTTCATCGTVTIGTKARRYCSPPCRPSTLSGAQQRQRSKGRGALDLQPSVA